MKNSRGKPEQFIFVFEIIGTELATVGIEIAYYGIVATGTMT